jgi:hypothetical protein
MGLLNNLLSYFFHYLLHANAFLLFVAGLILYYSNLSFGLEREVIANKFIADQVWWIIELLLFVNMLCFAIDIF